MGRKRGAQRIPGFIRTGGTRSRPKRWGGTRYADELPRSQERRIYLEMATALPGHPRYDKAGKLEIDVGTPVGQKDGESIKLRTESGIDDRLGREASWSLRTGAK